MGNPYPADFADDTGQVRLGGEITFTDSGNQPGDGGSQPGAQIVRGPFSFAFDTPNLDTGVEVGYTPAIGDLIVAVFIIVTTAFDGTSPQADCGCGSDFPQGGLFSFSVTVGSFADLTQSELPSGDVSVTTHPGYLAGVASAASPLILWASQDGSLGGAPIDSTVGAADLYIVTSTPTPFS